MLLRRTPRRRLPAGLGSLRGGGRTGRRLDSEPACVRGCNLACCPQAPFPLRPWC
jgi:hypothetical protein